MRINEAGSSPGRDQILDERDKRAHRHLSAAMGS